MNHSGGEAQILLPTWVAIGAGRLALWRRPKLAVMSALASAGCDQVVTLLSEREHATSIGDVVQREGMKWTRLPLANGSPPIGDTKMMIVAALSDLSHSLDFGTSMLLHCSAGIHRTGMVAYALLRWCRYTEGQSLDLIAAMRRVTREGMQAKHIQWGNDVFAESQRVTS